MNHVDVLNAFRRYVGIKLHFNSEAYVWKHRSTLRKIDEESLNRRNDFHYFDRLAYQVKEPEEQEQFLISVFFRKPDSWIGEVFDSEVKDFHRRRMIRVGALTHTFSSEVDNILDYMLDTKSSIKDILLTKQGPPAIIRNRNQIIGGVSDETLAILDKAFCFTKNRNTIDPLWNHEAFKLNKYGHCLNIDKQLLIRNLDKLASVVVKRPEYA